MADSKISALADGGAVASGDLFVVARGGTNVKLAPPSLDQLAAVHPINSDFSINSHRLTSLLDPVNAQDAATKNYVDQAIASAGGGGGGSAPTLAQVLAAGSDAAGNTISNIGPPSVEGDAAQKANTDQWAMTSQAGTTYTLQLADMGSLITFSNTGAITVTCPPFSAVPFPAGATVMIRQFSGTITVVGGAGVTVQSRGSVFTTAGIDAVATLVRLGTADHWILFGDIQ